MANVAPVITQLGPRRKSLLVVWTPFTHTNTTGDAFEFPDYSDRSVQITGTFDSATVVLEGSNDGTNWVTLTDPQGNAISKTSAGLEQIEEVTRYIRPKHSGGTSAESITVTVLATAGRYP